MEEIKNVNGDTYIVLNMCDEFSLLQDKYKHYLIAFNLWQNENGEWFWAQGKYFLDNEFAAKRYYEERRRKIWKNT